MCIIFNDKAYLEKLPYMVPLWRYLGYFHSFAVWHSEEIVVGLSNCIVKH